MKKLITALLAFVFIFIFSFKSFASGIYYDSINVTENQNAVSINKVIANIENLDTVSYSTRQSLYTAKKSYDDLPYAEKSYVKNYNKLSECLADFEKIGDLNKDGCRNSVDLTLIKKVLLQIEVTAINTDVNQDGNTDIFDIIAIKKLIVGL